MRSTDHGVTWESAPFNGLPSGFSWNKMTTNRVNKMFLAVPPAEGGGDDIYYSDDAGVNWTLTNSAGHYSHANAWIEAMYAVGDYVFAAVRPAAGDFYNAAPYLISSTDVPNFEVGDTSGLFMGLTAGPLPLFFHIGDQLYTISWDLVSSTPGFSATASVEDDLQFPFNAYPNPTNGTFYVQVSNKTQWTLTSIDGKLIANGITTGSTTKIDMETLKSGIYLLQTVFDGHTRVKKAVKM